MTTRNAVEGQFALNRDMWLLTGKCIGAVGANPTGLVGNGITGTGPSGVVGSIVRTGPGTYTLTIPDKYAGLVRADFSVEDSLGTKQYNVTVKSHTVGTATTTILFTVFQSATAVAPGIADLISTDTLKFTLWLSNSKQVPLGY